MPDAPEAASATELFIVVTTRTSRWSSSTTRHRLGKFGLRPRPDHRFTSSPFETRPWETARGRTQAACSKQSVRSDRGTVPL